jgi:hypothetical protein
LEANNFMSLMLRPDSLARNANEFRKFSRGEHIGSHQYCACSATHFLNSSLWTCAADLREFNKTTARRVPDDAPIGFIRRRWQP